MDKKKNKKSKKEKNMSKNKNRNEESKRKWEKVTPIIEFFAEHPDLMATIIEKSARGGTFKVKR